jgi:hypothetical protein
LAPVSSKAASAACTGAAGTSGEAAIGAIRSRRHLIRPTSL